MSRLWASQLGGTRCCPESLSGRERSVLAVCDVSVHLCRRMHGSVPLPFTPYCRDAVVIFPAGWINDKNTADYRPVCTGGFGPVSGVDFTKQREMPPSDKVLSWPDTTSVIYLAFSLCIAIGTLSYPRKIIHKRQTRCRPKPSWSTTKRPSMARLPRKPWCAMELSTSVW